jgi:PRC-barrel domain protein
LAANAWLRPRRRSRERTDGKTAYIIARNLSLGSPVGSRLGGTVITVGSITDWVGLPVLDRDGSKIGSMEAVYFDTSTEEPVFITVKVGLIGSSLVFVPLADAVVSPKDVRVAVDKKSAKDAPSIETDGQLESAMEPAVFEHYGLAYSQGASGERRLGRR